MAITAVELYERLRDKLGTEASLLVRYIEEANDGVVYQECQAQAARALTLRPQCV